MSKRVKKSLDTLTTKARLALSSTALVGIASSANSPNSAYELAFLETGDAGQAQSCRFLAMVKRDYGKKEFNDLVLSVVSQPAHSQ